MDTLDAVYSKNKNFYIARFEVQVLGKELKGPRYVISGPLFLMSAFGSTLVCPEEGWTREMTCYVLA